MPDHPAPLPASPPLILNYQRAEKAKRTATGGLLIMGIAFVAASTLLTASAAFAPGFSSGHPHRGWVFLFEFLITVAIVAIPLAWGSLYIICALLIHRSRRWAGRLALVMTSIQALAWLPLAARGVVAVVNDRYESLPFKLLICSLLLLVTIGFLALVLEVWRALRAPQLWRN